MTTAEKLIKNKLGFLQLASYLQNVSEACRVSELTKAAGIIPAIELHNPCHFSRRLALSVYDFDTWKEAERW